MLSHLLLRIPFMTYMVKIADKDTKTQKATQTLAAEQVLNSDPAALSPDFFAPTRQLTSSASFPLK